MKKTEKHALTVRIALLVMLDILFMQVASFASLWIRHEFDFQAVEETFIHIVWRYMPLNILVTLAVFSMFHLYTSLWKYASITELSCIVAAVAISSLLHVLGMAVMGLEMFKSYLLLYFLLFLCMVVGLRFSYRFFRFVRNKCNRGMVEKRENVMIIGAGDAGAAIIKENRLSKAATRKVCCLIDKDPKKWGRYILGCPVVGGADKIMESVEKYKIQKIVIAIPSATSQQIKELVEICKETKCELKILPGIYQLIDGEVSLYDNYNRINMSTTDYKFVINEIVKSKLVISSSLHGIILAETYGIPAILLNSGGDLFKYMDWYESTGRNDVKVVDNIEKALNMEPMRLPKLEEMQEKVLKAFPKDLWE